MAVTRIHVLGTLLLYLQATFALPGYINVNQNKPTLTLTSNNNQGINSHNVVGPTSIPNRMIEFRQNAQNNIANLAPAQQHNDAQSSSNLGSYPLTAGKIGQTNLALVLANPTTTDALRSLITRNVAYQNSGSDQDSTTVGGPSPLSIIPISVINRSQTGHSSPISISPTPLQIDFESLQNQQRTAIACSTPSNLGNVLPKQNTVWSNQLHTTLPVCNQNVAAFLSNQALNSPSNQPITTLSQNPPQSASLPISSLQLYPNTHVIANPSYCASPSPYQSVQHSEEPKNSNLKMLLPLLFDLLKEKDTGCGCNCHCKCCCNQACNTEQPHVSSGYASEVKYGQLDEESAPAVIPDEEDNEIDGGIVSFRERKRSGKESGIIGETADIEEHLKASVDEGSTKSTVVQNED